MRKIPDRKKRVMDGRGDVWNQAIISAYGHKKRKGSTGKNNYPLAKRGAKTL